MDKVQRIGCIACIRLGWGESLAEIHHVREGRIARNHFLTLPLCPHHHRESPDESVHKGKENLMRQLGIFSEFDLLADVLERIA